MAGTGPDPRDRNSHAFETERLSIEVPSRDDASVLYGLNGGEHRREINATLLWDGADDVGQVEEWISKCSTEPYGEFGFHWAIRDKSGTLSGDPGRPLGAIGTRPRDEPGRADVGYWLGRPYWGQGIMTEALTRLLAFGFTTLGNYKMEADVYTHNERGLRLVASVGMTREGLIRRAHRKYGEWVDVTVWGILVEEWEKRTR
jgi:RimJ/RimL family protein N-acetyltransferase